MIGDIKASYCKIISVFLVQQFILVFVLVLVQAQIFSLVLAQRKKLFC